MSTSDVDVPAELAKAEYLSWAETRGLENLREHITSIEALKAESAATLTILIAAGGAALAYAVREMDKHHYTSTAIGAGIVVVYLFGLGGILVSKCLKVKDAPSVSNEPMNLYQPAHSMSAIKEVELENIGKRIREAKSRTSDMAKWINRIRSAALFTPLIFVAVWCLSRFICL